MWRPEEWRNRPDEDGGAFGTITSTTDGQGLAEAHGQPGQVPGRAHRPWQQRFCQANPLTHLECLSDPGLGILLLVRVVTGPRSLSWSLVGPALEPEPEPCLMLHPAGQSVMTHYCSFAWGFA